MYPTTDKKIYSSYSLIESELMYSRLSAPNYNHLGKEIDYKVEEQKEE